MDISLGGYSGLALGTSALLALRTSNIDRPCGFGPNGTVLTGPEVTGPEIGS